MVASIEIVKVFGMEIFVSAVGQTMQNWMRVILWLCGSRRKNTRILALELLALLLRLSWDCFGSFSTVRIPLLSVIVEVIEKKIAWSTTRALQQRCTDGNQPVFFLPIECAEAAISTLWNSFDRLHHKCSSLNTGFKTAVEHLAHSMKTIYRACVASHALSIAERSDLISFTDATLFQMNRIVSASSGLSRLYITSFILHDEVIEEAFLSATALYSSTELPLHRLEWLLKLAEFHRYRGMYAEEAFCRYQVFCTWTKFVSFGLQWFDDSYDLARNQNCVQSQINDDSPLEDIGDETCATSQLGQMIRLIFDTASKDLPASGIGEGNLFNGVCPPTQSKRAILPIAIKMIERELIKEVERSADCFRRVMMTENSRWMMNHAVKYYARIHDYEGLITSYSKLAKTVCSEIPTVDPTIPFELSSCYGRFYRVWFHGNSLPDDLMGAEFVYRTDEKIKLEDFRKSITQITSSILPDKTPIDIVIDDGHPEEQQKHLKRRLASSIGRDPIKIKITPLRPCLTADLGSYKGDSRWFQIIIERPLNSSLESSKPDYREGSFLAKDGNRHRKNSRSSVSSSSFFSRVHQKDTSIWNLDSTSEQNNNGDDGITGVQKFSFSQPLHKDRLKGYKNCWKSSTFRIDEKSLRVTELHVRESFPCCVTRQKVIYRSVSTQSPLEASVEDFCSWCSILYRTIVAINGMTVIGIHTAEQGIGKDAVKVVADCIHRSNIRDLAQILLQRRPSPGISSEDDVSVRNSYDCLSDREIESIQLKLARATVLLLELLQLLIGRNRDLLLAVVKDQKRPPDTPLINLSVPLGRLPSLGTDIMRENSFDAVSMASGTDHRIDSMMTIQRELQRSLVYLVKSTIQPISETLRDETPPWLRLCCHENYFSSKAYRRTNLMILGSQIKFIDEPLQPPRDQERPFSRPMSLSDEESGASHRRSISPHGSWAGDSYHSRMGVVKSLHGL
jgi:hypothetical protein